MCRWFFGRCITSKSWKKYYKRNRLRARTGLQQFVRKVNQIQYPFVMTENLLCLILTTFACFGKLNAISSPIVLKFILFVLFSCLQKFPSPSYQIYGATITKCHNLSGSNNWNLFYLSLGGQKSEVGVWAGLVYSKAASGLTRGHLLTVSSHEVSFRHS